MQDKDTTTTNELQDICESLGLQPSDRILSRLPRAIEIADANGIEPLQFFNGKGYHVQSQSSTIDKYVVHFADSGRKGCSCKDSNRTRICKHILAALIWQQKRDLEWDEHNEWTARG